LKLVAPTSAGKARRLLPISPATRRAGLAALITIMALLSLPFIVRLDGSPHGNWQQFFGRFHPLVVHLPIGLILLVPLLEVFGRRRPALREAARFVLGLAFAACLAAVTLGYLLARGGGTSGATVTLHLWGGTLLSICVLVCLLARPAWAAGGASRLYPVLLPCTLLALVWTAHQGGSLTYGNGYLTEFAPGPLRRLSTTGVAQVPTRFQDSFYSMHIFPVLNANCVSCHGSHEVKGGLRLDSYELLMRGGSDGAVIVPGQPDRSMLFARITLPTDDKHFMPSGGRPKLKPNEVTWIKAWIQQGASPSAVSLTGVSVASDSERPKELPLKPVGDYSAMMPEIRQMEQSQSAKLVPISSNPSDGLVLTTVDVAAKFGDAQLAQFQKFAPYIVEAELGRTAVTNASFDTLSKFTSLRALHLEGTAVTGDGLAKLAPLSQLTYLNLSGTNVTSAALAPLKAMKNLHHVYLFNTPAQPASASDAR